MKQQLPIRIVSTSSHLLKATSMKYSGGMTQGTVPAAKALALKHATALGLAVVSSTFANGVLTVWAA